MEEIEYVISRLHGMTNHDSIPEDLQSYCKENKIVIVYGASDDLCEFDGYIYDEVGCYEGGNIKFHYGYFEGHIDDEEIAVLKKHNVDYEKTIPTIKFKANWNEDDDSKPVWTYTAKFPHKTFDILEFGEEPAVFCRGMVFYFDDAVAK